jgi:hypothetical protein
MDIPLSRFGSIFLGTWFSYRVVPKLSTPFQGVLELAYNTTVVKYAPVKHPLRGA